jgi:hypothetical protein
LVRQPIVSAIGLAVNYRHVSPTIPPSHSRPFNASDRRKYQTSNRAALGWAEDGPRISQADQPGFTSRDIAIYGFAVATPFIPAGIVSIYNAP